MNKIAILIPVYKPDTSLLELIDSLNDLGLHKIIVVRDGYDVVDDNIFLQLKIKNCYCITHITNLGKGRALKTGMNFFYQTFSNDIGVVTADADGQHSPQDIFKIAKFLTKYPKNLILGIRNFTVDIPIRSKIGNILTKQIFKFVSGVNISDTQTGLRGIPTKYIPVFLTLDGERYEYETNMLLETKYSNISITEIPIKTIYKDNNKSSHFNPVLDSLKIYSRLFRFSIIGFLSFIIDYFLFLIILNTTSNLVFASYGARTISTLWNYFGNKKIVFANNENYFKSLIKYLGLCVFSISVSYFLLLCTDKIFHFPILLLKLIIEGTLFFVNFHVQHKYIFNQKIKA